MKTTIFISLLVLFSTLILKAQEIKPFDDHPIISVNGDAVVYVKPDKIDVSFGIETDDLDITIAKKKNNDIMKKVIAITKELGVPEKEIQTDYLSIEPRYDNSYDKKKLLGYFVYNYIIVTVSETEKVEELITKLLQSGVNHLNNIDFQTTEFKKYREQARELALKAAKEKADKMAAVLGLTVGTAKSINEGYGGSYYYSGWRYGRGSSMTQNAVQNFSNDSGSNGIQETIALGKVAINANVSVTFELNNLDK
jgi:hypothetical protein